MNSYKTATVNGVKFYLTSQLTNDSCQFSVVSGEAQVYVAITREAVERLYDMLHEAITDFEAPIQPEITSDE